MNRDFRTPLIAGNWKLNKTLSEAIEFINLLKRQVIDIHQVDIVVCPVYTALASLADMVVGTPICLGAQDLYWEEKGAFTGEVSGSLIKDAGATSVIIGHSERRQFFGETDKTVNKKTKAALSQQLMPIVCVGETLKERESGNTFSVIETQLQGGFHDFSADSMKTVVIAYEPVWAIGTGKVATPAQAQEVHAFIRHEFAKRFQDKIAQGIRILYGGSVKPDNIASLMAEKDIDGALVGGASLDAKSFGELIQRTLGVLIS